MADRKQFIESVSGHLGRPMPKSVKPPEATALSMTPEQASERASEVRRMMNEQKETLFTEAAEAAQKSAWVLHRASNAEDLAEVISAIAQESGARSAMLSTHEVLVNSPVEKSLQAAGLSTRIMAGPGPEAEGAERDTVRAELRKEVFQADLGITGVDWFITESGTVVLKPRQGVSRLLSLAPPRHIAVLEKGSVLPSLDELFALERADQLHGVSTASMNLISGPSRTGDIEGTVVTGIHGPYEVHLVMLG